jgi:hypothetical protein
MNAHFSGIVRGVALFLRRFQPQHPTPNPKNNVDANQTQL